MTAVSQPIVSYGTPPVTEVVVAVAFRPLNKLSVAHIGAFWQDRLREYFPTVVEREPYDPPVEDLEGGPAAPLSFSLGEGFPPPRVWFLSSDDQDLVQVQRNWFACNWRRVGPDAEYGRWASRREALERWLGAFEDYVKSNGIGAIDPIQCEVTYINHIEPNDYWKVHGDLDRVMRLLGPPPKSLPRPEKIQLQAQYLIEGPDGEYVGRVHVNCTPVYNRKDGSPALALNLTARGLPLSNSIAGAFEFLDLGRDRIVRTFDALTTDEMHRSWEREGLS